jgi:hypothetical protein
MKMVFWQIGLLDFLNLKIKTMLFYLSEDLLSNELSAEQKAKVLRAIEYILRSVWESKHLVKIDYLLINRLLEEIKSDDCKSVLISIRNSFSFLNYDCIKYYVKVVPENNLLCVSEFDEFNILNLPIDYLQKSDITNKSIILCEHISDANFFKYIAEYYIENEAIGNLSLNFESDHGGGGDINVVFDKYVKDRNRFCLAFCDNDIKYPNAEAGQTLRKLAEVDKGDNYLCDHIEIGAHEIENLVPFNYIDEFNQRDIDVAGLYFIKNIFNSDRREDLKYIDLKKGICTSKINTDNDYKKFAISLQPFCRETLEANIINDLVRNYNETEKHLRIDKKIVPPVGKIVKSLFDNPEIISTKDPELLEYQRSEWNRIGSNFMYWACARNLEPINI